MVMWWKKMSPSNELEDESGEYLPGMTYLKAGQPGSQAGIDKNVLPLQTSTCFDHHMIFQLYCCWQTDRPVGLRDPCFGRRQHCV